MGKDDNTWVNICYLAFAGLVAFVCFKAIETLGIQLGWVERYDEWFPTLSPIVGMLLGSCAALWLRSDEARREYHVASVAEVRKVTWPSIPDTKKMTVIVVVVVAIFAVILAVFDIAWSKALQLILP